MGTKESLDARGQSVEVLFGFLGAGRLALVPWAVFSQDVQLPADASGVVCCRLGGLPAALVQVTDTLFLDVAALAMRWPQLVSELAERAGEATARAMLERAPILEVLGGEDRLTELILEHQIRAENLYLLGEQPTKARALGVERRFALKFERGTLELALDPEREIELRWKGTPIALPRPSEIPWRPEELAELAVIASMTIGKDPHSVVQRFEAALPDGVDAPEADDATRGTILNLWGVALRNTGKPQAALQMLARALPIAERADPELEQQVAYNLGYTKLLATMKQRQRVGARDGSDLYSAHYDLVEKHRATWNECLALFERAAALDPSDATARSQVDQTRQLLSVLDGNARPMAKKAPPASPRVEPRSGLANWFPLAIALVGTIAFLAFLLSRASAPTHGRAGPAPPPPVHEPSERELSEAARIALLDRFDLAVLPMTTDAPCSVVVTLPEEVPAGTVVAPPLARAIGTGELYGTEYLDATLRAYMAHYAPDVEVRPATRAGVGPLTGARGPEAPPIRLPTYRVSVLVTGWRDPVPVADGASLLPGEIEARLLVWSYAASRFVCAADVIAANGSELAITRSADPLGDEDDPLNRARVDLIEQALRVGIPRLTATADE